VDVATGPSFASPTYIDWPNLSTVVTLTATAPIQALASVQWQGLANNSVPAFRLVIDSYEGPELHRDLATQNQSTIQANNYQSTFMAPGPHTVKVQVRSINSVAVQGERGLLSAIGLQGVVGPTGPAGSGGANNATQVAFGDYAPTLGASNVYDALYRVKAALAPGSTGAPGVTAYTVNTISRYHYVPGVAGKEVSNATGFVGVGAIAFDPNDYVPGVPSFPQHVKFQAVMETATGVTATLQLYNLSVGTGVSGSELYTTYGTPTFVASADLTLPNAHQLYEVQLRVQAGTSTDQATVKMARLEISHG
jgi:hypothetical protein